MRKVGQHVHRGAVIIIDYGDRARALYTRDRRRGTLAAYAQHRLVEQPLAHPGQQDLTGHVNFSALIEAGRAAGLRLAGLTTQRDILLRLGIQRDAEERAVARYPYADSERHTDRGQRDHLRRAALRNAIATLLRPEGLGGFRVLVLHRGIPHARDLTALRHDNASPATEHEPSGP
jgi:SAM-dependent MidA family methyltransferase